MINIYSIKEILEASDSILKSSNKKQDSALLNGKVTENKKYFEMNKDKPLLLKKKDFKENIPLDIEKIILEAENSQLKIKNKKNNQIENIKKKDLSVENKIIQKELINELYKMFGKKIKKNTLQLILELRKNITFLTNNISHLELNKKQIEQKNIQLNKNIYHLNDAESNLQNNLKRSKESFNSLYVNHRNLKLNFNTLEEDLDYKKKKLSITGEFNVKLENKIKNLEEKLIEYKDIELNLSLKVQKLENHIFINKNTYDELVNQNSTLEKNNTELKNKLDSVKHIDIYVDEINQLKLKNKDLENTIDKLKSYEDNNDQNLNIIKELENKIRYYQEENIRISNQLYEANKRFDIIKSEIEVLQDQRSSLISKINSVNDVIGNTKIVTNVFQNNQIKDTQIIVDDPNIKKVEKAKNLDEEIFNIFNK